jgi:hypothetical protein
MIPDNSFSYSTSVLDAFQVGATLTAVIEVYGSSKISQIYATERWRPLQGVIRLQFAATYPLTNILGYASADTLDLNM